jgi:hypothetical protein
MIINENNNTYLNKLLFVNLHMFILNTRMMTLKVMIPNMIKSLKLFCGCIARLFYTSEPLVLKVNIKEKLVERLELDF